MATTVARLQAVLGADTHHFDRAMDRSSDRMHRAGAVIGKAALAAGAAIGVGLGVAAKVGFDEFREGQRVTAQTNAALKSTQGVANVTGKHIDNLANSILRKTGIDDEATKTAENMLLTFTKVRNEAGKSNKIFDQATVAITNMATRMNQGATPSAQQLQKASIQVGKALQDPVKGAGMLARVGVVLDEQQKKQIKTFVESGNVMGAQKVVLRELGKEFGGSALASGKTFDGQMNILKETFKNTTGEIVGRFAPALTQVALFIAPLITKALDGISKLISNYVAPAMAKVSDVAQSNWPRIQEIGQRIFSWIQTNIFPIVMKLWQIFQDAFQRIRAVLESNGPALQRIFDRLAAVIKVVAAVAIPILRIAFTEVLPRAINIAIGVIDKVTAAIEGIVRVAKGIVQGVAGAFNAISGAIRGAVNKIEAALGGIRSAIRRVAGNVFDWAKEIGRQLIWGIVNGIKSIPNALKDALVGAAKGAVNAAKGALGIGSPSKLTEIQIGKPMAEGVRKGILSGKIAVSEAMVEVARSAVDKARDRVSTLFGTFSDWISRAFSAKQAAKLTPTEILINKKELERQKADLADAITSARADLATAQASGDPEAIKQAQKALDDALYNQWLFDAQRKAEAERKDLENQQWLQEQAFNKRLASLQAYLESGHATAKGATRRINALLKDFGLTNAKMGDLLGKAFVAQLRTMERAVANAAAALRQTAENEQIILEGRTVTIKIEKKKEKGKGKGDPKKVPGGGLVAIGHWLQSLGYQVGENPAFGGVSGGHVPGSYHYQGRAIDVNWPGGGAREYTMLKRLLPSLSRTRHVELMIEDVMKSNQHLHFAMGKGGIVTGPTLALIGEKGPEAVVPLDRGGNITIPVSIGGEHVATVVFDMLRRKAKVFENRNGRPAFGT